MDFRTEEMELQLTYIEEDVWILVEQILADSHIVSDSRDLVKFVACHYVLIVEWTSILTD
jgi:hypothetical protein